MPPDRHWWKFFRNLSLRGILTLPFLTLLIITVSVIGFFAYRGGQRAIDSVAQDLRSRTANQIEQHLSGFLAAPTQIIEDQASLFQQGLLDATDPEALRTRFFEVVGQNPTITSVYFANLQGGIVGSGREGPGGDHYMYATDDFTAGVFRKYRIDDQGQPGEIIQSVPNFDARTRGWYKGALDKNARTWNNIYVLITGQDLALAASQPVYNSQNELVGVVSVDIFLTQIGQFLHNIDVSPHGLSYIIDREGMLVATSTGNSISRLRGERLQAIDSSVPLIKETAKFLLDEYQSYHLIPASQQHIEMNFNGQRQFLQIQPLRDLAGIDWLIVVAIPESDYMGVMLTSRQMVMEITLAALLAAIILSFLIADLVTRRIATLSRSTRALEAGKWDEATAPHSNILEIDALGHSFNDMSEKLRLTMDSLTSEIHERRQIEASLRESERRTSRLLTEEQRHSEMLTALNQIGRAVISNLDFDQVLRTLYEQCCRVLPVDVFYVAVYDESTGIIEHPLVIEKGEATKIAPRKIQERPGLSGTILRKMETVYLPDTMYPDEDWAALIISTNDEPVRAYIGVPMIVRGKAIGVISIQSYIENAYTQEQIHLLEIIADQVAAAVVNARLFEQVQYNARFLALLHETTNAALQEANLEDMLQVLANRMGELFQADGCFIARWDEAQQLAIPAAAFGSMQMVYRSIRPESGEVSLTQSVLEAGHALAIDDTRSTPYMSARLARIFPMQSMLSMPLITGTQKFGAVTVAFNEAHTFSVEEMALGELAAAQMALAIAKNVLVTTDELTRLYNRRGLFNVGQREVDRSHAHATPLTAILFDIDNFKHVNDLHGHAIGDQVLADIAERCQRAIRASDSFGRYGGEEFIILLPETSLSVAMQVAERVRNCVAEKPIETTAGPIQITVSAGVACLTDTARTLDLLIDQADNAMYAAKQHGRNQVMVFEG